MRRAALVVAAAGMLATFAASAGEPATMPDDFLTPGAVADTDPGVVCKRGYAKAHRHTSNATRAAVYRAYGIAKGDRRYVIDHRVPIELGGADVMENLWPEPRRGDHSAHDKDRLEKAYRRSVCSRHSVPLAAAQAVFMGHEWWPE